MTNNATRKLIQISQASLLHPGKPNADLPKYEGKLPTLYVFRHGESKDNRRRIFSGRRNTDLTEDGILQSLLLARKLRKVKIDIAMYPPLIRCRKTLKLALKSHRNTIFKTNELLIERDYGNLTGKSKIKLNRLDPILIARYRRDYDFPPPNGESLRMVWENRIKLFCNYLNDLVKDNPVNIAVCCTNNTMRLIRMHYEKLTVDQMQEIENPLASDYCSYSFN